MKERRETFEKNKTCMSFEYISFLSANLTTPTPLSDNSLNNNNSAQCLSAE